MQYKRVASIVFTLVVSGAVHAQTVQVNPQNRTIELSTESTIEVQADIVRVVVGYHNYAPTHDAAYEENIQASSKILKAWTDVGIPENVISTDSISLRAVSDDELKIFPLGERKQKQFEATQSWAITANTEVAQRLLDVGVAAGANEVDDPEWKLSDPDGAEARAYASALEKARAIATKMAAAFGSKIGTLLYASNQGRPMPFFTTVDASVATVVTAKPVPVHPVKLFPKNIEKSALVRAIFSIE